MGSMERELEDAVRREASALRRVYVLAQESASRLNTIQDQDRVLRRADKLAGEAATELLAQGDRIHELECRLETSQFEASCHRCASDSYRAANQRLEAQAGELASDVRALADELEAAEDELDQRCYEDHARIHIHVHTGG